MVFDSDDFGCSHIISEITRSHDCRDALNTFKKENPKFKATLFTIPGELTVELIEWAAMNRDWVELAWHGFYHRDNYECSKMTYEEFGAKMKGFDQLFGQFFIKGFKAPGWQIGDEVYRWLLDNDYWISDQGYNDSRRPIGLKSYTNYDGVFKVQGKEIESIHTHTWDVGEVGSDANGVYEYGPEILKKIKGKDFKFVSEVLA